MKVAEAQEYMGLEVTEPGKPPPYTKRDLDQVRDAGGRRERKRGIGKEA